MFSVISGISVILVPAFHTCVFILSGFAFVYFEDERDGDDAIRALDGYPFGPGRRRLSVEWSRVISYIVIVNP